MYVWIWDLFASSPDVTKYGTHGMIYTKAGKSRTPSTLRVSKVCFT